MRGLEQIPWLYDALMSLSERTGLGRWRRKLVGRARGRVLEVGCGTGRNLPIYAERAEVEHLVALEPDLRVLLTARRRAPSTPLVVASAEALPFRDAAFDAVVSSLVFCSVPDPRRGLDEAARVLAGGGALHMMEHVRHDHPWLARFQDLAQPFWTWLAGGCHPNRDTESEVAAAGFVIETAGRRARGVMRLFSARPRGLDVARSAQSALSALTGSGDVKTASGS